MALTQKQTEYIANASHRWNIKTGATRSGKTFVDYAAVIPKRIMATTGNGLIVLLGYTQRTLERNIFEPMRSLWGSALVGQITQSQNTIRLFGKTCHAIGADKVTAVARLQGSGIEYAYGDEVPTWNEDVFSMLKSRLDKATSVFDGTGNPGPPNHWFKQFLDSDVDIYSQHYIIDDNPMLDPGFVANLKREYAGTVYYDRYILGLWKMAEGAIYRQFADNPKRYIIDAAPDGIKYAWIGVDFGGNGSAHAFSALGTDARLQNLYVLDEHYRKEIIDPRQLENDFTAFIRAVAARWPIMDIRADSAEQVLIKGLNAALLRERLPYSVKNAAKSEINDRIRFACQMMATDRFKIAKTCTRTIDAISSAVWDSKHLTEDVRLDDGRMNIDSLDAMEYAYERQMRDFIR